jgi:hypothetical protein
MLPDFPMLKHDFERAITRFMRARSRQYEGPIANVPKSQVFEGHETAIVRIDEKEDITEIIEARAELQIPFADLPRMQLLDLLGRLDEVVKEIAATKAKHFYETIAKASQRAGTAVDAKGSRLTAEYFLDGLEKVWIEFKSDGTARMPELVVGPALADDARQVLARLKSEPELQRRFNEIMIKKREEWRAREANRELVG